MFPPLLLSLVLLDFDNPLPPRAVARLAPQQFHLDGHAEGAAVSPDGRRVSVAVRGGVEVWSTATGRQVARYEGRSPLAYSPDGRTLAVLGAANAGASPILLLDAATGRESGRLPGDGSRVEFAAFAGARTLVTGTDDHTFRVWDLRGATQVRTLPRPGRYYPKAEAVSSDGRYLAAIDRSDAARSPLHVYEIGTGREVFDAVMPTNIWALTFAPDGRSVVCGGPSIYRYEVPTGRLAATWQRPAETSHHVLACADDAVYLLDTTGDALTAHDLAAGRPAGFPLRLPVCAPGRNAPDSVYVTWYGSRLKVWDLTTGRPRHPTFGHDRPITGVALTADGLAVTADGQSVRRWDAAGREERVWPFESYYRAYASALSPDGRTFASGDAGGVVRLWDTATGRQVGELSGSVSVVSRPAFSPDGRTLAYPGRRSLRVWDVARGRQQWDVPVSGREFASAAFAADGRTVFSGDARGTIREWDAATGKEVRQLQGHPEFMERPDPLRFGIRRPPAPRPGHTGWVAALTTTPDGRRLISAGDQTLRVWELATGQECARLERETSSPPSAGDSRPDSPCRLATSPDGSVLAASGYSFGRRRLIDLWDLRTGRRYATLIGHRGAVSALSFAPDGRRLISGGEDAAAFIWDVPPRPGPAPASTRTAALLWVDLASADAARAYRALGPLAAAPDAVATIRRLAPAGGPVDARRVSQLVADLDADRFTAREAAAAGLRALGPAVDEQLRTALAKSTSAEARSRIEALLTGFRSEDLRGRRAVEVLEAVGSPEARALLDEWAKGEPSSTRAKEAAAARARLSRP